MGRNAPARTPSSMIDARALSTAGHFAKDGVVEMGSALGDLPEPDRGKVRPRLRFAGKGVDERADLFGRREIGGGDGAGAGADGAEHVAEDVAVEPGLAAEVVVDHRLVEARGVGDAVDAGAGESVRGEGGGGGGKDAIARGIGAGRRTAPAGGAAQRPLGPSTSLD